jgi:hypothetical protein
MLWAYPYNHKTTNALCSTRRWRVDYWRDALRPDKFRRLRRAGRVKSAAPLRGGEDDFFALAKKYRSDLLTRPSTMIFEHKKHLRALARSAFLPLSVLN